MPTFTNDGLDLHFHDEGEGPVVLLIHGFASNIEMNWRGPGWIDALVTAGYRAIALDNRGHGRSERPHEPERYTPRAMRADASALLEHLGIVDACWMGYSMGARIAAFAALDGEPTIRALVLGGLGEGLVTGLDDAEGIAEALLTDDPATIQKDRPRMFRAFADRTRSDRRALAACIATSRQTLSAEDVATIEVPTLVAVGGKDDIAGSAHGLAAMIPNAEALEIPDRDHMLAVGDKAFKAGVLRFLRERGLPSSGPRVDSDRSES